MNPTLRQRHWILDIWYSKQFSIWGKYMSTTYFNAKACWRIWAWNVLKINLKIQVLSHEGKKMFVTWMEVSIRDSSIKNLLSLLERSNWKVTDFELKNCADLFPCIWDVCCFYLSCYLKMYVSFLFYGHFPVALKWLFLK